MCDPGTGGLVALQGIQSFAAIDAQNDAAAANRSLAVQAQNDENEQTTRQFIEQNRSLLQGSFDAILEGRANEASAYTSAIENGVQGSSVRAVLRDQRQQAGRNKSRSEQERKSLQTQTGASLRHIGSKTQGRINSVAPTRFSLGDAAGILAPIAKSQME